MNERALKLLEFDVIRSRVAGFALSEEAAAIIQADQPRVDSRTASDTKAHTAFIAGLLLGGGVCPNDVLPVMGDLLPKLAILGSMLTPQELLRLGTFIEHGQALLKFVSTESGESFASMSSRCELISSIPDCSGAAAEVFKVIDRDGNVRDLPPIRAVRQSIANLTRELGLIIGAHTSDSRNRQFLQSALPSQRDGRTVIAIKASYKGRIRGIVREVSSSGQTLFIEPDDVVEKNNDIIIEKNHLDEVIRQILRELTAKLAVFHDDLAAFHRGILYIETIRARAKYSIDTKGVFTPFQVAVDGVSDTSGTAHGNINLKQARHPLLGAAAVPIDISMTCDTLALIVTGPNTGGKTVTLKTLGLFALMNQFGLAIPAQEGSTLPFFDGIYADIGDEQSLEQSLSTFSAHMKNIAAIIAAATGSSLVLLDELGSGTDPLEGSAIAISWTP
jgi:DNA mismatch repair protein MutS2